MAKKPGKPGQYRMCQDLRELNDNTVPAPYLTPNVAESLDRIAGKKLYCSFDFSSWFHQFELAEEDRDKVAFIIPGDHTTAPQIYRFKRVCFGLLNATWFTQRQLQEALEATEGCEGIYPFVDDVVIAADSIDEMVKKLEAFMKFCADKNIKLKREKCVLASSAVKHLGFIVGEDGKHLDPARVECLMNIGAPKNLKGLKSLLGSFSFVRAWIANMAEVAAPLTDLMSETANKLGFKWGPEEDEALAALKIAIAIAPATMEPDYSLPFHISVDASDVGVGAVLWQWRVSPEGRTIPCAIAHASRRFSSRETRWQISEKEMYSWKYAFENFEGIIRGHPDVTLHTDHLNLVTGLWAHCSQKIERWRLYLEQWKPFKIVHIRGTAAEQAVADGLSRLHARNLNDMATLEINDEESRIAAELGEGGADERLFSNSCSVQEAWQSLVSRASPATAMASSEHTEVEALEEVANWEEDEEECEVLAAPVSCEPADQPGTQQSLHRESTFQHRRLLELAHDDTHPSLVTTWRRVQRMAGFPYGEEGKQLKEEVRRWCAACVTCQKLQPCRERVSARIGTIRQRPFTCYSFDCIVLNDPDEHGNRYILVVIDSFSRAVELFPMVRATAEVVAGHLHDVFCRWGRPHEVRCDNAKSFLSATVSSLLKLSKIKLHKIPAYSHQTNGQVENMNRRVMSLLRAMILDARLGPQSKVKWSFLLPAVRRVIMTRMVTALGCTPNELAYCISPDTESSIFDDETWREGQEDAEQQADAGWDRTISELRRQHEQLILTCDEKQEEVLSKLRDYNANLLQEAEVLQPGDFVLVEMKERPHSKLQAPWSGPYQVISHERNDPQGPIISCQHLASKKIAEFHVSMLKKCNMDQFESPEDAVPYAAMDSWEWEVERVTAHFPAGPRKLKGRKMRAKREYEFEVWWKNCPEGEDNPTIESWEQNTSLRTCQPYLDYLAKPEVRAELGDDFAAEQPGDL
jgi:transposase InsO family protein